MTDMKRAAFDYSFDYELKRERKDPDEDSNVFKNEPPSLLHMTVMSVTINLWLQPDVTEAIEKTLQQFRLSVEDEDYFNKTKIVYEKLHERIAGKVTQIPLPASLKLSISDAIEPIGLQLLSCFIKRDYEYCNVYNIIKNGGIICWTAEGTIDKIKSLEHALKSNIGTKSFTLFKLASMFCLEEYITDLWINVKGCQELIKMSYRYDQVIVQYWIHTERNVLPTFFENMFSYDPCNVYRRNLSINQNMISLSIFLGNVFGVKYFLKQLADQEVKESIDNWLLQAVRHCKKTRYTNKTYYNYHEYSEHTDILFTLLSHLEGEAQKKTFFSTHCMEILNSLLFSWPFQRLFLPIIIPMLKNLHKDNYVEIMSNVADTIKVKRTSHEIFRKIWKNSSDSQRKEFLHDSLILSKTIWMLLGVEDWETIDLMLNDLSPTDKNKVIFKMAEKDYKLFMFDIFSSDRVGLFENLLSKTQLSEGETISFKLSVFETFGESLFKYLTIRGNFQAAKRLLEWDSKEANQLQNFKKDMDVLNISSQLICIGDYETFSSFLKWYFETEDEINDFKKSLVYKETFIRNLLIEFSKRGDQAWDLFEKFTTCNQWSTEELAKVKSTFLEGVKVLVRFNCLKFASKVMNWCLNTIDEERIYKHEFLLNQGVDLFVRHMDDVGSSWDKVKNLLRWFDPNNIEIMTALKTRLSSCEFSFTYFILPDRKRDVLFHLLDCFIENYNENDRNFAFGDEHTLNQMLYSNNSLFGNVSDITDVDDDSLSEEDLFIF